MLSIQPTVNCHVVSRAVETGGRAVMSVVEAGVDNSEWMARLPEKVRREVALLDLSIPGSHDSLTYNLPR